jgi:hypothetical protein
MWRIRLALNHNENIYAYIVKIEPPPQVIDHGQMDRSIREPTYIFSG